VEFERVGVSEVKINSHLHDCEVVRMSVSKEAALSYVSETWDVLKNDPEFREQMFSLLEDPTEYDLSIDYITSELERALQIASTLIRGPFSAEFYVRDNMLVRVDLSLPLDLSLPRTAIPNYTNRQTEVDFHAVVQLGGANNLIDVFQVNAGFTGLAGINFIWFGNHLPTDGIYDTTIVFDAYNALNRSTFVIDFTGRYDSNVQEDNIQFTLDVFPWFTLDSVKIKSGGSLSYDSRAKTISADMPDIELIGFRVRSDHTMQYRNRFAIKYGLEPIMASDVYVPEPVLLLEMSARDIQAFMAEIVSNVAVLNSVIEVMGF
jgi:hypothetical protein